MELLASCGGNIKVLMLEVEVFQKNLPVEDLFEGWVFLKAFYVGSFLGCVRLDGMFFW